MLPQWLCSMNWKPQRICLQTNKPTKKNKNKTTWATTKVESYRKFYQQFYFRNGKPFVLVAFWWLSHSKRDRHCKEKALRRGFLNATNGIRTYPNFKKFPGEDSSPPGHRQAFRPIISHHNANSGALSLNSFLEALSIQHTVVGLMIKKTLQSNSVQIWRGWEGRVGGSRGGF